MTDWSKALEVFGSGIIGVYLVMVVLQLLTQVSIRIIDLVESRSRNEDAAEPPQSAGRNGNG